MSRALRTRRGHAVVASGDGHEYGVFVDLDATGIEFRDTVAMKLKPVRLLNQVVFVGTRVRWFNFDA